jgi:hypothetical protein
MPYKFLDSQPVPAGVEANLWFDAYNNANSRIRKQHRHHPTSELRRSGLVRHAALNDLLIKGHMTADDVDIAKAAAGPIVPLRPAGPLRDDGNMKRKGKAARYEYEGLFQLEGREAALLAGGAAVRDDVMQEATMQGGAMPYAPMPLCSTPECSMVRCSMAPMQCTGMQYAPMAPAPQDLYHNDAPPMANNSIGVPDQHAFIAQFAGAINRDAVRVAQ